MNGRRRLRQDVSDMEIWGEVARWCDKAETGEVGGLSKVLFSFSFFAAG